MTRPAHYIIPLLFGALAPSFSMAQCEDGQLEVRIQVHTDTYGNETMWQLVQQGAACGASPIFVGGNPAVTCASAGSFESPPGGYAGNTTIATGPWCLVAGAQYDIICVDSYGDGQAAFTVLVEGVYAASFPATGGAMNRYTFTVRLPEERDMAIISNETSMYGEVDMPVLMAVTVKNVGSAAVTSFGIGYTVPGGSEVTETITGNLAPGAEREVLMSAPWLPQAEGANEVTIRITGVNGESDQGVGNDNVTRTIRIDPAIPDRADDYLLEAPALTQVANADQDILVPRDLDFHPDRSRNELWVINKGNANTGGNTVKFTDPGEADQTFLYQRDPAVRHFMSLPTGIAMGDNNAFATCPGIYDANGNQSTTTPFTGPTLWSADPAIYAQNQFGPLGSHLDMLHVTPRSQGIAHERWNRYWVVDGHNRDVVMHDFKGDHGPGQDYHGNAVIHRYTQVSITRDPNDHIVSHCVLDKRTGWLYIVDNGGQRILRLNTRTGNLAGTPSFGPFESYVQYRNVTGATVQVIVNSGLQQPAGIEVVGNSLYVSDHATGEIIIYDMANGFAERGRIAATPGIMGIKAGFDGRLWYVNATNSTLVRVDPANEIVGIAETTASTWSIHPNPASTSVAIVAPGLAPNTRVDVRDSAGRLCLQGRLGDFAQGMDVQELPNGVYTATIQGRNAQRLVIAR
ncbi:MAG: T9SS type A sorting domain-containing protein [Flavobacteriales bacterium]|nr:T9SS type A sorting domain-containing protein [Flavobacteriales bacterium]